MGVRANSSGIFNNLSIITILINMPKMNIKVDLEGESPVCFFYSQQDARLQKKTSITLDAVIEKLRLFTRCDGTNLQLSDSLDASRVTNPGNTGSNHLLPTHWRRFISPLRSQMAWALCPPPAPVSSTGRGFFMPGCQFGRAACVFCK